MKHDIRTQDQAELAALRIPTAPKILCDAAFENKRLLLKGDLLREYNISRGSLSYHTVHAFEKFDWDEELIGMLQGFQGKHPHDILPMGVIQVGLLDYWWDVDVLQGVRTWPYSPASLANYLVYFAVCLARAVAMGTVFIEDPFKLARAGWNLQGCTSKHCRGLDCKINDDSIDSRRCFELINRRRPKVIGKILTSDLEGAQQPRLDPDCDIFRDLLHVQGITTTRDEAIRDTVRLIGNMRQHGAGRLLDLKAKRHFILMPMSVREPWDTSPIEVFEDGAADTKTLERIEKAHQARIYKFPDEDDEPYDTSRKRTRAMIREQEDRLPYRKRQRMAQQVPGWDELSDQVKTIVKLSRMENTSPDDLTEAANFLRRVEGFEHGYRAGSRPNS
ncbi:hypothetical protein PG996_009220 [Apiospora saccharicola]|uniref:Uncharacterized protein n=1 Tax=Apiospora saccharicola TaxID=335842 RepID=A0ABR1UK45_9PEZI